MRMYKAYLPVPSPAVRLTYIDYWKLHPPEGYSVPPSVRIFGLTKHKFSVHTRLRKVVIQTTQEAGYFLFTQSEIWPFWHLTQN